MAEEKTDQEKVNKDYKGQLGNHNTQLSQFLEVLSELGKKCKDNKTYSDKL